MSEKWRCTKCDVVFQSLSEAEDHWYNHHARPSDYLEQVSESVRESDR